MMRILNLLSMNRSSTNIKVLVEMIACLTLSPTSSGIVNNETDDVVWRNPVSISLMKQWKSQCNTFRIPVNTRTLHNTLTLNFIREKVRLLAPAKDLSKDYLLITYSLVFPEIGFVEVQDRFYRIDIEGVLYRIWINVFSRRLPHALS
jgi:hypothetical protein